MTPSFTNTCSYLHYVLLPLKGKNKKEYCCSPRSTSYVNTNCRFTGIESTSAQNRPTLYNENIKLFVSSVFLIVIV